MAKFNKDFTTEEVVKWIQELVYEIGSVGKKLHAEAKRRGMDMTGVRQETDFFGDSWERWGFMVNDPEDDYPMIQYVWIDKFTGRVTTEFCGRG